MESPLLKRITDLPSLRRSLFVLMMSFVPAFVSHVIPGSAEGQVQLAAIKIAFQSNRDGNHEVYVMNADGTNLVNFTNHPADDQSPRWSPDETKVAFRSDRDGNREIYVMNALGANLINLTNHPADDGNPSWSPDGTKIAFRSDRDGNEGDLCDERRRH